MRTKQIHPNIILLYITEQGVGGNVAISWMGDIFWDALYDLLVIDPCPFYTSYYIERGPTVFNFPIQLKCKPNCNTFSINGIIVDKKCNMFLHGVGCLIEEEFNLTFDFLLERGNICMVDIAYNNKCKLLNEDILSM